MCLDLTGLAQPDHVLGEVSLVFVAVGISVAQGAAFVRCICNDGPGHVVSLVVG